MPAPATTDTSKNLVKSVFPNARCFMFDLQYAIMEIPEALWLQIRTGYMFDMWPVRYSRWFPTSKQAWDDAWITVQTKLLDKLEE